MCNSWFITVSQHSLYMKISNLIFINSFLSFSFKLQTLQAWIHSQIREDLTDEGNSKQRPEYSIKHYKSLGKGFPGKENRTGKFFSKRVCWAVITFPSVTYENKTLNYLKRDPQLHNTLPCGLGTVSVICVLQTIAVANSTTCLFLFKGFY